MSGVRRADVEERGEATDRVGHADAGSEGGVDTIQRGHGQVSSMQGVLSTSPAWH